MFLPNCVIILLNPEISLKSQEVKSRWFSILKENMVLSLKRQEIEVEKISSFCGRIIIDCKNPLMVVNGLKNCFGISSFFIAEKRKTTNMNEICVNVSDLCENNLDSTFAVRGKSFCKNFSSKDLEIALGSEVLKNFPELKVKLKEPKSEFFCLAIKGYSYFYFKEIKGIGGLPVSTQGTSVFVANKFAEKLGFLLLKSGINIIYCGKNDLSSLEKYNSFKVIKKVEEKKISELFNAGKIMAVFSDATNEKELNGCVKRIGLKPLAPLYVDSPKTPFD